MHDKRLVISRVRARTKYNATKRKTNYLLKNIIFNDKGRSVDLTLNNREFTISVTIKDTEMYGINYLKEKEQLSWH